MKTLALLLSSIVLCSSVAFAFPWEGEYTLSSGLKVRRTPENISFVQSGLCIAVKNYTFSRGSSFNGTVATGSGVLSLDLSPAAFRQEVLKLGGKLQRENIKEK